ERQAAQRTAPEQGLLDAAAVAGESFSIAALASALGWDDEQVESCCETLVKQQVILRRCGLESHYCFIHGLCRDALFRKIPAGQRARLHGKLDRSGLNDWLTAGMSGVT